MLLSGGIDSATCLYDIKEEFGVRALTFRYHGIGEGEVRAATRVARLGGVLEHRFVSLPDMKEAADLKVEFQGLPLTYIPMRNSVFYSFAASFAEEVGASAIVGGHNKDDQEVFRDTNKAFFQSMQEVMRRGSAILEKKKIRILRPLQEMTKSEVIRRADLLGVPLGVTWSCHSGGKVPCLKCEGCASRETAFRKAGLPDPATSMNKRKIT